MPGSYGRLLVDGSGAMVFFDRSCPTCAFISPAGQSGTLVALGSDTAFQLTPLDGSFAIFRSDGYLVRQNVLPTVLARRFVWTASPVLLDSVVDTTGRGFKLTYSSGLLTQITDFASRSTGATIASGKLVKVTYADGAVDSLTYNANNLLTQLNSRTGGVWNYGYNALFQGDTVRAPSATDYTGASVRPTTTVVTAAEVQWQSGIAGTSLGAPKGSVRPDTIYQSSTDPVGSVTKSQADRLGLATKVIDPLGHITTITRDTLGNPTVVRDPTGRVTTGTYVGYFLTAAYDSSTGQLVKYTYGLSTANQGSSYGWIDPDGGGGEVGNALSLNATDDQTVAAANRVYNTLGDPTAGANLPASDGKYTIQFKLIAITPTVTSGNNSTITAILNTEYSTNSGASWTSVGGPSNVTATRSTPGVTTTTEVFAPTLTFSGGGPVWIRLILRGTASGTLSGGQVKVLVFANGVTEPYPVTWFRSGGSAPARLLAVEGGPSRIDYSYHDGTLGPKGALMLEYVGNTLAPGSVPQGGALVARHYPNAYGQDTLVVDGLDHKTRSVYAALVSGGDLVKTINPVGDSTRFHYDSYGLPDTTTLPNGVKEGLARDVLNRIYQARNGLGYVTQYTHSTIGLSRVIDPKSQVYKFGLNSWGLMVSQHDLGDTTKVDSVKYDAAGRVRTVITRRGDAITLTYDQLGRLQTRTGPDFPAESLSYGLLSAGGSWVVASSAHGRDSLAFDKAGQLVYALQRLPGDPTTYAMTYSYDTTGHLINRTALPNGTAARWVYRKNLGVLDTLCAAGVCTFTTRDAELKTLQRDHPGGQVPWLETFFYDSLHRVTFHDMQGGNPGLESSYRYDMLSRVIHSVSTPKDTFWYDAAGQLINACNRPSSSPCTNEYNQADLVAYAYDSAGNRIDTTAHAVIAAGNRVTQFKGYAITYDANGNTIKKAGLGTVGIWTRTDTTTFEWNAIGQLVRVETWPASGAHTVVTFRYDALGRRISKRVNMTTTRFLYDRDRVLMDLDSATGVMKAEYGYTDGGALYAIRTATDTMIVISTPTIGTVLGTQRARDGLILKDFPDRAGNDPPFPWGQEPPDTGFIVRYRMAQQEYDQEIGIYHMGARYYDPMLGRWLSEDPVGIEGGMNLYQYVGNDPVNRRDPSGLGACEWISAYTFHCYAYESDCLGGSLQRCVSGMAMAFCASIGGRWVDGSRTCVMPGVPGSRGGGTTTGGHVNERASSDPGKEAVKECRAAILSTTFSLAADITLVVPAIKAYKLFAQGGRLEVYALLRSADGARSVARGVGLRSVEITRAGRATVGATVGEQIAHRTGHARFEGDGFNWRDITPIWGTGRAAGKIGPACSPD
jgi:RHS repeat-associated protein